MFTQKDLSNRELGAALAETGMISGLYADVWPDRAALITPSGTRTFKALHERANRLANLFRARRLAPGDGIALICRNGPTFIEAYLAAHRSGLRITPVNWHLAPGEAAYIVENCDARALVVDAVFSAAALAARAAPQVEFAASAGGRLEGFDDYERALAQHSPADPSAPRRGSVMLYTSGTTGRPKGVYRAASSAMGPQLEGTLSNYDRERDMQLCCGPVYHAAPLGCDIDRPIVSGVPIVMMDKWDAEEALRLIQTHRITHTHMVPTMFRRLLDLPRETSQSFDLSSLKIVVHGAAPCPVDVKSAMIEWLGPILLEYYAATEGSAGFLIGSDEWRKKPGSVGRLNPDLGARVLDDQGAPSAVGQIGTVYFRQEASPFLYYKAAAPPEPTPYFTLGDLGYVDEDGYLFLTGRSAEIIISGGVNIYPQEIDDALAGHSSVQDVCTVGAPDAEWGERVIAVVQLRPGVAASPELAEEIRAFARTRLSAFKCPREITFEPDLPRMATGKIQRSKVRAALWANRERSI